MVAAKPKALHTVLETRVALEALAHLSTKPLHRFLPQGDGHPVLVIPGFLTNDAFTSSLRSALCKLGYDAHPWEIGFNTGLHTKKLNLLKRRVKEISMQTGQKVSLIGWSLGGFYARAVANQCSEHVRQVITLGSPFGMTIVESENVQNVIGKMVKFMTDRAPDIMMHQPELWQTPLSMPFTSIFSVSDGIVNWRYCLDRKDEKTENIRIPCSHTGLTHNPLVLYLLSDRLLEKPETWQPFSARGWRERLFDNKICRDAIEVAETQVSASA